MEVLPLATVKAQLSRLIDQVEHTHQRILVTRNGKPAAVLISADDLESIEETLAILSDPDAMKSIRASQRDVERGDVLDEAQLAELIGRRRGRASA
jgi:antitoxin YefM